MLTLTTSFHSTGDSTPPTIQCGADINQGGQCGATSGQVQFPTCTAEDNQGTPTVTYTSSRGNVQFQQFGNFVLGTFLTGQTVVTATATDACGLTTTDTFIVNINPGKVTNQIHSVKNEVRVLVQFVPKEKD